MTAAADTLAIGPWRASRMTGRLEAGETTRELEPKVMDLLFLLASRRGQVLSREDILQGLWGGVTVGEDALSRCVFKLRRALDDDPRRPRYIETIPKRGYRLLAETGDVPKTPEPRWRQALAIVGGLVLMALAAALIGPGLLRSVGTGSESARLTARADDLYFQFSRRNNEAAITLYRRALAAEPRSPEARAGLANAMVQQVIRYGGPAGQPRSKLGQALQLGVTRAPEARARLADARRIAEQAIRDAPGNASALKALGFVRSAQGDLAGAEANYRQALRIDPDAWGVLINLGDVTDLRGDPAGALPLLQKAYEVMGRLYGREAVRISPWQSELGVNIAQRLEAENRQTEAEAWYRRALAETPLHPAATVGLAKLLARKGDRPAAAGLCTDLIARTGPNPDCASLT
jgi:transcriptional activator of cad operon